MLVMHERIDLVLLKRIRVVRFEGLLDCGFREVSARHRSLDSCTVNFDYFFDDSLLVFSVQSLLGNL
jgi:hypothetical protein